MIQGLPFTYEDENLQKLDLIINQPYDPNYIFYNHTSMYTELSEI